MSVSERTPLPAAESTAEVVAEENYPTHRLGWLEDAEHASASPSPRSTRTTPPTARPTRP